MAKSIIENSRRCFECGVERPDNEKHHILKGTGKRSNAEKYGLWVYLCPECHRGTYGVHGRDGHELDLRLKMIAQEAFEKDHTREEFREIFIKSFL